MFRIENLKCGGITIETDCPVNVLTQNNESISFLYLTETDFNELVEALITWGVKRLVR